jgi:hypothetical protein
MIVKRNDAFARIGTGAVAVSLAISAVLLVPRPADANPTFARMTGHTCAVCHVPAQEPLLNPTGQEFKGCGFSFCKGPPSAAVQPAPQPPVHPPRPQPAVTPAQDNGIEEKTALGHNGSTIEMTRKNHMVTMRYIGVRPGLSVPEGSLLFSGTITDSNKLQGTAYTFKRGCPPAPYAVSGVQTNNKIVLRGPAPVRDPSGCAVVEYDGSAQSATLQFDIAE